MKASKKTATIDRMALLGSSRGLGWATYQILTKNCPDAFYFLSSRKINNRSKEVTKLSTLIAQDFSKTPVASSFLDDLKKFNPTTIIYLAGGGPHGPFEEKKWSDHQWALNTCFLYPAELLHLVLSASESFLDLQQIIFVGSAIAEDRADPLAASYAAAKHALKGLITSVQQESSKKPKVRLFSPGYMQTELLPVCSKPRQAGIAEDAFDVAKKLIAFIEKND
ncbi:MAG: SDR family NAD(P)-dependent oxidoreductase [Bdellovibrionaceae bacterium]|nr:SDR family NAD(P)-dependent oxidoreductase [Bdellovibrio sp.]